MNPSSDLENWMAMLPESIRSEVPIINLAIPGSHDSCSYGINKKAKIAPDAEKIVKKLYAFIPCVIRRWAKTQAYDIGDQLKSGIRYFDLRVASNSKDGSIYFVHGLFCEEISEPFECLDNFLKAHPKELVILDFQHFYEFQAKTHEKLINCIMNHFKTRLYERDSETSNLNKLTLSYAFENSKQLVIIYRNGSYSLDKFFRSYDYPTPWPQTTNVECLKNFLEKRIEFRTPEQGFVSQCVITPDSSFIVRRFYSSLRKACAAKVNVKMSDWLREQTPGEFEAGKKPTSNVFLADFVDISKCNFCRTVVDLNMKLMNTK